VSPKAAAALARRLLQDLLRGPGGVAHSNLATEIAAARTTLPASIATCLDVLRHVGNFAAHPIKDTATGTIIDVEVGEAEFTLDVILQLFEHYFVTPAIAAKAKDAINQMLVKAGKQPIP
jgi:hypothetical protein